MPPAIGAMVIIFFMIIGYFTSNNLYYGDIVYLLVDLLEMQELGSLLNFQTIQ